MCTQKPPNDYSEPLYAKYREAFSTYISERVRALDGLYAWLCSRCHQSNVQHCAVLHVLAALSLWHHEVPGS